MIRENGKQKKLNRNLLVGTAASAAVQQTSTANCLKTTQSISKYWDTVAKNESGNVTNVIENGTGTRESATNDSEQF
ncbi:unnamed protein product [Wuchereria bancrofti]|uniref:Uncharacterized protein n=1 Tax=Wuchereria bancrofti TaxID=6293 RepID=A0A3P7DGZ1_WUCBA|nr:unnamed protein product [Wuchereria bancrofti]